MTFTSPGTPLIVLINQTGFTFFFVATPAGDLKFIFLKKSQI